MIKNIFITGKPGAGKTRLIMEIIREQNLRAGGFYTSEIREQGTRLGFNISTLDGKKGVLAHANFKSPFQISKYKVNLKDLEEVGVKAVLEAIKNKETVVVDEVGKMELVSDKFKKAVLAALESEKKVLGTIKMIPDPFTNQVRKREDTMILNLTKDNREEIKKQILSFLGKKQGN